MYSVSILIPVYNYDIVALVHNLRVAIEDIPEYVEIILGDDGSSPDYIARYKAMENGKVRLITACCNIGRAAIRNRLAEEASGDFLLFIDADALITGTANEYLRKWLPYIEQGRAICGGTLYPEYPPADPDKMLRWKYGRKREQKKASEKSKTPLG
jgi:glycosyltransferase involved in cell wall biosynthesis